MHPWLYTLRRPSTLMSVILVFAMPVFLSSQFWTQPGARYFEENRPQDFSPLPDNNTDEKYLSFEPWNGGWNNRRMSLELAFLMCYLTNRVLVLPPKSTVYLMSVSSYEDFFNISKIKNYVKVIRWSDYEKNILSKRSIKRPSSCKKYVRTALRFCNRMRAGRERSDMVLQWNFLRSVIQLPSTCANDSDVEKDLKLFAPHVHRDMYLGRQFEDLEPHSTVHFPQNLFGLFYAIFYFSNMSKRGEVLRVMKDAIQFRSSLVALADPVVTSLGGVGSYSCLHVRRGDFKRTYGYPDIQKVVTAIQHQLLPTTYVATDDQSNQLVNQLQESLPGTVILTKANFSYLTVFVDPIELGVVEQLICSLADIFIGTRHSTFSSYITRLRGYNPNITNKEVYLLDETFDGKHPKRHREKPYSWTPWGGSSWAREFPESWENVD